MADYYYYYCDYDDDDLGASKKIELEIYVHHTNNMNGCTARFKSSVYIYSRIIFIQKQHLLALSN